MTRNVLCCLGPAWGTRKLLPKAMFEYASLLGSAWVRLESYLHKHCLNKHLYVHEQIAMDGEERPMLLRAILEDAVQL